MQDEDKHMVIFPDKFQVSVLTRMNKCLLINLLNG